MKRFLSLVCVAMLTMAASAQITWNAKGGFGVATCYGSDTEGLEKHLVGKLGVGIEYPLSSNLSLMPSLEFAWKGTEETYADDKMTLDLYYLQVPIVAAYRMNLTDTWNLTLKAGPYFGYAVSDKITVEYQGQKGSESADNVKKFDAGLDVGVDFEHHRFVFGLEAEMGFCPMIKDTNIDVKNLAFYATIGWKF